MNLRGRLLAGSCLFVALLIGPDKLQVPGTVVHGQDKEVVPLETLELVSNQGTLNRLPPDEFSWWIFAAISRAAPNQRTIKLPDNSTIQANDVQWEQWADNCRTFPNPVDPNKPPQFSDECPQENGKNLQKDPVETALSTLLKVSIDIPADDKVAGNTGARIRPFAPEPIQPAVAPVPLNAGQLEEVRRNQMSFNYIVKNNLWYWQGIAAVISGSAKIAPLDSVITMPDNSIEVKAMWHMCAVTSDTLCNRPAAIHLNYDNKGQEYALVAIHIMTKNQSKWTWSSWEWAGNGNTADGTDGNPGRCDFINCIDTFGSLDADGGARGTTASKNNNPSGKPGRYRPGKLTDDLTNVLTAYGLAPEWRNYRLKSTQEEYLDGSGKPTLNGNSQIETGFVASSSCITCHGRAGAISFGQVADPGNMNPALLSHPGGIVSGPVGDLQTSWFVNPATGNRSYYRVDSIWSLLWAQQSAVAVKSPKGG